MTVRVGCAQTVAEAGAPAEAGPPGRQAGTTIQVAEKAAPRLSVRSPNAVVEDGGRASFTAKDQTMGPKVHPTGSLQQDVAVALVRREGLREAAHEDPRCVAI
jgi:hypothetical protein